MLLLAATIGFVVLVAFRLTPRTRPNILLITLDTTRADHLGAYGYRSAQTPRLDRLANEGVLFERVTTAAPITLPAHASLLTATYPFVHGVRNNGNFSLRDGIPTVATVLHDRGYRTAAFVSAFVLDRRYGLARGFDLYDDRMQLERRGDQTASAALEWLRAPVAGGSASGERAAPFFLWLHLFDPHDPYEPPPPFGGAFADRPYDGEIAFDDTVVASMLQAIDRLGQTASTIVAVVGDHGESLGDHDEATHAVFVYDSTLRVPMIVAWPGHLPAGRRVSVPLRSIDLSPTLLDLAGAPPLQGAQGRSLVSLAHGRASAGPSVAYAESYFPMLYMNWAPLRSIQDERWKFIDAPTPELYDLASDPREGTNLADRAPGRVAALRKTLDELTGGAAGAMAERRMDRDTARKLAALGYVGSSMSTSAHASTGRPDPKAMIGVFNAIRDANAALQRRQYEEAATLARAAMARDPQNAFATIVLANANLEAGRCRDAIAGYRAYLETVPDSADAHHRMAICYSRLAETDRALIEEDAALAIDPRFGDAHDLKGGLLATRGRTDEAIRELTSAVEMDPDNVTFRVGLARVLVAAGRLDEADRALRRALELQPDDADAHAGYAGLLVARGQPDAAISEFERSLSVRPDADDVRLDLGRTLDRLGRAADARREYEKLASAPATPPDIRRAARARLRP